MRTREPVPWAVNSMRLGTPGRMEAHPGVQVASIVPRMWWLTWMTAFLTSGPEAAIPTFNRISVDDPGSIIKVFVKAWTRPLPMPGRPGRIGGGARRSDQ